MAKGKAFGFLQGTVFLAVLGVLGLYGWFALTAPWIYTVGRTRFLPLWEGMATAHGPGGDYKIYIGFYPSNGPSVHPATWVDGFASVCAPDGTQHYAHLGGGTGSVVWKDMNNMPFNIYLRGATNVKHMLAEARLFPSVDMVGRWDRDKLVMQDGGTLAATFAPNGSDPKAPTSIPAANQSITFEESFWGFTNPCR